MFKSYFTVAVRNLIENRLYTAINIFGLVVGLASCILILLYVRHEVSYDSWIPDADRIHLVQTRFQIPGREPIMAGGTPGPAMAALTKDFNEIESAVRLTRQSLVLARGADVFREDVILADPTFFDVFDLPLVNGNRETALADVSSVLLSEKAARKYFGDTPPLGQVLPMTFNSGLRRDYRVAGVFKDFPTNSNFEFTVLVPINPSDFEKQPWVLESWTSVNGGLFLKLKQGADAAVISKELPEFERRNIPNQSIGGQDFATSDFIELGLLNLEDVHLHGWQSSISKAPTDERIVTAFAVVAGMILLIAGINFTNLATARASQRAREVALRKALGARRAQLVFQFLGESVLLTAIAFILALGLVYMSLPLYNTILQRELGLGMLAGTELVALMITFIVAVGLVAGLYPALYLSRFLPARILKANKSAAAEGSGRLRMALVIVQFAISIGLLICTTVIYSQTIYARSIDVGFDRTNLLVVRAPFGDQHGTLRSSLASEAAKLPGVMAVTLSDNVPTDPGSNNNIFEIPGKPSPSPILIAQRTVDYNFFETYRVPLLAGRYFQNDRGGDDFTGSDEDKVARGGNIILNESALESLDLRTPEDAIGKTFYIAVGDGEDQSQSAVTVVGVVADVTYMSVRDFNEPTFYQRDEQRFGNITLKLSSASFSATINAEMERLWRELAPTLPYRSEFMEVLIEEQYRAEEAAATMFGAFSVLAIVIGCLGLYGLALFSAERRTKEIGIRKVLGARVRDIVRLLVMEFSKPVLIANLIAWPVAWLFMRDWLDAFQQRIDLSPVIFVAAGLAALGIAWVTVGSHALRAARENPIRALRYE